MAEAREGVHAGRGAARVSARVHREPARRRARHRAVELPGAARCCRAAGRRDRRRQLRDRQAVRGGAAHVGGAGATRPRSTSISDASRSSRAAVDETTALLAERFDHIFYTGNGRVGRVVMEAAAKHLTPVTLELGGKSPVIVDSTREPRRRRAPHRRGASSSTPARPASRPTTSSSRRTLEQPLVEAHRRARSRDFYGDRPDAEPRLRAASSTTATSSASSGCSTASGTVAIGGDTDAAERYIAPDRAAPGRRADSPVMADEIFGPILPVLPVDDVDEAIAFVNERDKPLALYVFSESHAVQRPGDRADQRRAARASTRRCSTSRYPTCRSAASARAAWARTTARRASTASRTTGACSPSRPASIHRSRIRRIRASRRSSCVVSCDVACSVAARAPAKG